MSVLARMRRAVTDRRYIISFHANEELSEDGLTTADVKRVIRTGRVDRKYTKDPRGARYEVVGETTDGRLATVVCRFLPTRELLIITGYAL